MIRTVYLPEPLPHQQEVLDDPHRFKCCCWGRQAGKTAACSIAATDGHGPRDSITGMPKYPGALWGKNIWWVTKDYPTAEKIWRDLKEYLSRWGGNDLTISEVHMRIDFPNRGSISVKSAATSTNKARGGLRGDTIHGLIMDEAAFCPEDTWALECQPMLMRHRGWVIFVSTPDGMNWFHDIFERGDGKLPEWKSWHMPTHVNTTIHPDELANIEATCDKYKWAREYLAEFNVAGGVVFEKAWFKHYRPEGGMLQARDDKGQVFGPPTAIAGLSKFVTADFAMTVKTASDYTCIATWGSSSDGRLWLLDLWRGKMEWPDIVPRTKAMYDLHSATALVVEASGPLVRLNAEARYLGLNVQEWHIHEGPMTEKKDKVSRNGPAAPHVQAGRILFPQQAPWLNTFISECCAFPMGEHDDQVDCLGAAVWYRPPNNPPPNKPAPRHPDDRPGWGNGVHRGRRSQW